MTTENTKPGFVLAAFKTKRDAAQAKKWRWKCSTAEFLAAYAADVRDFRYADLGCADLGYSDLRCADLGYAYLGYADLGYADLGYADLECADLGHADLRCANLGHADLRCANLGHADLRCANLGHADLRCANLRCANVLNCIGIYSAYAPNLSSRGDSLFGEIVIVNGKLELRFWAGCKKCVTAKELLLLVKGTHGDNIHAQQYKAAIEFIQACFKSDMAAGKWDYLLTWQSVNPEAT